MCARDRPTPTAILWFMPDMRPLTLRPFVPFRRLSVLMRMATTAAFSGRISEADANARDVARGRVPCSVGCHAFVSIRTIISWDASHTDPGHLFFFFP